MSMRSLYDDMFDALSDATYTIDDVSVRHPYDESPKTYPMVVLHEIVNIPKTHATVSGEERTALSYQLDIQTQNCIDGEGEALTRWEAGRRLTAEVNDLLDEAFKFTRRTIRTDQTAPDVLSHILRGDVVYDSHDTTYRL
jgi:hypothetical protein